MKSTTKALVNGFFEKHKELGSLASAVEATVAAIARVVKPNKVMICGSGGSAADSGHIVGELMKNFRLKRPADTEYIKEFERLFGCDGEGFPDGAIPAVSLVSESALMTAVINDNGAGMLFSQQVYGLGYKGDVLIGITTSGNSGLVINAFKTAKALGVLTIAMTGATGGKLKEYSDILLNVPETETYKVQELHLPLYHLICAAAELERWDK